VVWIPGAFGMTLRRENEIRYVTGVEAVEAHSAFAKPEHADSLAGFLRSRGVKFRREDDVVGGDDDLLIDKELPFGEYMELLDEWKRQYADGAG
jgi:hypothetical protein